jgi:hypothetical protein
MYSAQRAAPYINYTLFTMAMRGSGDSAIPLTTDRAVKAPIDVVATQQQMLGRVFNSIGISMQDIPQMWCLYSEVQGYYEAGMTVPDDITLLRVRIKLEFYAKVVVLN